MCPSGWTQASIFNGNDDRIKQEAVAWLEDAPLHKLVFAWLSPTHHTAARPALIRTTTASPRSCPNASGEPRSVATSLPSTRPRIGPGP